MDLLNPGHPSFSCRQAWFLFGMRPRLGSGLRKLLLVEARTRGEVHVLEWLARDGRVSPTCELLAVHRDCGSVGIRSAAADEIPFGEFLSDLVDPGRLAFLPDLGEERKAPVAPATAPAPEEGSLQDAEAALTDLGFKKAQVRAMVDKLSAEERSLPIAEMLRTCLRRSKAA